MKKINNLLVLVSIVSSLLIIFLLNKETIPLHFNKLGVVDRYGSKFELLLMPFFVIIIYLIIISIKRYLKCDAILFDFLSFEMLLFMNFLFLIIYVNIFFIVNLNYKGFKIEIPYSCSCFFSYFILHFGVKVKDLQTSTENKKIQLKPFFYVSVIMFIISILINSLLVNKSTSLFVVLFIFIIGIIITSICVYVKNKN